MNWHTPNRTLATDGKGREDSVVAVGTIGSVRPRVDIRSVEIVST
jgi:hypothetical protein